MKVRRFPGHLQSVGPAAEPKPKERDGERDADGRGELALIGLAREGDAAAFRALFDLHFQFVLRTCSSLGLSGADADDALQETFIAAHRNLDRFSEGSFTAWLYRIAHNVVSTRHRRSRVRRALFSLWAPRDEEEPVRPDRPLEAEEARRAVQRVLAQMSPKKREVFALFELEGLSGEAIAGRVGCSVATVWTRLFHARREFQRLAREQGLLEEPQ